MRRRKYLATDGKLVIAMTALPEGGFKVTCPFEAGVVVQAKTITEAFASAKAARDALRGARKKSARLIPSGKPPRIAKKPAKA